MRVILRIHPIHARHDVRIQILLQYILVHPGHVMISLLGGVPAVEVRLTFHVSHRRSLIIAGVVESHVTAVALIAAFAAEEAAVAVGPLPRYLRISHAKLDYYYVTHYQAESAYIQVSSR